MCVCVCVLGKGLTLWKKQKLQYPTNKKYIQYTHFIFIIICSYIWYGIFWTYFIYYFQIQCDLSEHISETYVRQYEWNSQKM